MDELGFDDGGLSKYYLFPGFNSVDFLGEI